MKPCDVLVVGGSLSAIALALECKSKGKHVVVMTHRSYLGEDVCDSLRLAPPPEVNLEDPLARELFGEAVSSGNCLRPMHIKHSLDRILCEADIPVILCAAPVSLRSNVEGLSLSIQTRSGAKTLLCHQLVDGTLRGDLARLAGVPLTPPSSSVEVTRRVIAGSPLDDLPWVAEGTTAYKAGKEERQSTLWSLTQTHSLEDGSWASWMALEQQARLSGYRKDQDMSADSIFAWTGERLHPECDPQKLSSDLNSLSPESVSALDGRLWVTGPIANVDERTRARLLDTGQSIGWGRKIADLLISESANLSGTPSLPQPEVPRIQVDVLVIGGGTGGAPAAIGAARSGADTLVVEVLSGLGGVGTLGLIGRYWYGNLVGFTAEIDQAVAEKSSREIHGGGWDIEAKMQWYHEQISLAGGKIWYKTSLIQTFTENNRVTGALLATPQGPVRVDANCVVDATGSGEAAALSGAETVPVGQSHLALQGTGLPGRNPGVGYQNTDYDFIDESNADDSASAHITAREKFKNDFDAGQHIDSRERRRIVGDYEITPMDIRLTRVFPDSIVKARSNFDTHGFTVHPLFMIVPPGHEAREAFIPLRALLPKGLEGILVTGLGISAHRDAMPVIRMQGDVQNQGYAAGVIAAMAGRNAIRDLDILDIQAHLVDKGILDPEIRGANDSFPLPEAELKTALQQAVHDPDYIDRIFTLPNAQRDAGLCKAYTDSQDEPSKRFYAFVLGILHNDTGKTTLANEVAESPWDKGWDYTGMGQFGESMSPLDARIIALGRCSDPDNLDILKQKAETLPSDAAFSHYRALAEAIETIGSPKGVPILESLLARPGLTGHAITTQTQRNATATDNPEETKFRNNALIELHLAAALFHLSPGNATAGSILQNYAQDLRGLFSGYAKSHLFG